MTACLLLNLGHLSVLPLLDRRRYAKLLTRVVSVVIIQASVVNKTVNFQGVTTKCLHFSIITI